LLVILLTGNYLVSLPAGGNFKLTYKYKSYAYKTLDINTTNLEGYDEKIFDINFDLSEPAVVAEIKKDTVAVIAAVSQLKIQLLSQLKSLLNLKARACYKNTSIKT
jgi:hypothetical protein